MDNSLYDRIATAQKFQQGEQGKTGSPDAEKLAFGMGVVKNMQDKTHERNSIPQSEVVARPAYPIPN